MAQISDYRVLECWDLLRELRLHRTPVAIHCCIGCVATQKRNRIPLTDDELPQTMVCCRMITPKSGSLVRGETDLWSSTARGLSLQTHHSSIHPTVQQRRESAELVEVSATSSIRRRRTTGSHTVYGTRPTTMSMRSRTASRRCMLPHRCALYPPAECALDIASPSRAASL